MDRNTAGLIISVALFLAYAIYVLSSLFSSGASQGIWFSAALLADGVILFLLGYGVFSFWNLRKESRHP